MHVAVDWWEGSHVAEGGGINASRASPVAAKQSGSARMRTLMIKSTMFCVSESISCRNAFCRSDRILMQMIAFSCRSGRGFSAGQRHRRSTRGLTRGLESAA